MHTDLVFDDSNYRLSRHAVARMGQRGIGKEGVSLELRYADQERHVGGDCYALSCSPAALAEARRDGISGSTLDRMASLVLIVAGDGTVVTAMNRETRHARFQHGHARLSARERARKNARHGRGGGYR